MADHVDVWMRGGAEHAFIHGRRFLAQLDVWRGDDHIEYFKHRVGQVERSVLEDVDLDALEKRHALYLLLHLGHLARLRDQALSVESVNDRDAGRVIGDTEVPVAERLRALGHLQHRGSAVAPVRSTRRQPRRLWPESVPFRSAAGGIRFRTAPAPQRPRPHRKLCEQRWRDLIRSRETRSPKWWNRCWSSWAKTRTGRA